MLAGKLPFDENDKDLLYDKILECKYSMPPGLSFGAQKLLRRIFVREPAKRIKLDSILSDRWVIGDSGEASPNIDGKIPIIGNLRIDKIIKLLHSHVRKLKILNLKN